MFNTRNVLRIISTTNEITTSKIGLRKPKKPSIVPLSKTNNITFKNIERQHIFAGDKSNNEILELFFKENRSYLDASFILNVDPKVEDKVNDSIRDCEIEKLVDLNNVYFGLPINIICDAVAIIDRFISKVKVKPKYMPSLTAACLHLVATSKGHKKNFLTCDNLANLHRSGATGQDLERMKQIVIKKLQNSMPTVTILDFIREFDPKVIEDPKLIRIIEVAMMRFSILWHRPSRVASACLIVYYQQRQEMHQLTLFEKIYDVFQQNDWDVIKFLNIHISEQCSVFQAKKSIETSRNHLLWIISRKSLCNFHTSSPPLLETISEENDDCFNLNG